MTLPNNYMVIYRNLQFVGNVVQRQKVFLLGSHYLEKILLYINIAVYKNMSQKIIALSVIRVKQWRPKLPLYFRGS